MGCAEKEEKNHIEIDRYSDTSVHAESLVLEVNRCHEADLRYAAAKVIENSVEAEAARRFAAAALIEEEREREWERRIKAAEQAEDDMQKEFRLKLRAAKELAAAIVAEEKRHESALAGLYKIDPTPHPAKFFILLQGEQAKQDSAYKLCARLRDDEKARGESADAKLKSARETEARLQAEYNTRVDNRKAAESKAAESALAAINAKQSAEAERRQTAIRLQGETEKTIKDYVAQVQREIDERENAAAEKTRQDDAAEAERKRLAEEAAAAEKKRQDEAAERKRRTYIAAAEQRLYQEPKPWKTRNADVDMGRVHFQDQSENPIFALAGTCADVRRRCFTQCVALTQKQASALRKKIRGLRRKVTEIQKDIVTYEAKLADITILGEKTATEKGLGAAKKSLKRSAEYLTNAEVSLGLQDDSSWKPAELSRGGICLNKSKKRAEGNLMHL